MRTLEPSSPIERIVRWSTLALAAMPVLGMRPMVWTIVVWLVLLVVRAVIARPQPDGHAWRWWLVLAAPFLLMVLDLLRADDAKAAWHIVERSASLALFPAGFFLLNAPADRRTRIQAIDVLTVAALALSLYANGHLLFDAGHMGGSPQALFSDRYRHAFAEVTRLHPPFAAYYFACAALFQVLAAWRDRRRRVVRLAMALVLVISMTLIGSRMPLMAFLLALVLALMIGLPRRPAMRGALLAGIAMGALVLLVPSARQRMAQALAGVHTPTSATVNSVNIRKPISQCSLELLEEHWITGMGQPRVQPALDHCYERFNIPMMRNGSYSTHCQPLHWWIAFGLLGLAAFLLLFGLPLRDALRVSDGEAVGLLVFIGLCCLTENVLARQWGVVLFAYFNALFLAGRERA